MHKETIKIANLKCGGCANTITKRIAELNGVEAVQVDVDQDEVEIIYNKELIQLSEIKDRLHSLGYPEATEENGLLTQLKSYASCMVGRLS